MLLWVRELDHDLLNYFRPNVRKINENHYQSKSTVTEILSLALDS
jgi:hypothetical protein